MAAATNEQFVEHVQLLFYEGEATPQLAQQKARAHAWCQRVFSSLDGWKFCLQKLTQLPPDAPEQVRFWCLKVILSAVSRVETMPPHDRVALRTGLMSFVRNNVPKMRFTGVIKNKLAQVLVSLLQREYPHSWPSFFHDFLGILQTSPEVVDMFLRVLCTIEDEIVDCRGQVSERSTLIKDTMRDTVMSQIVSTLHSVLNSCQSSHPALARGCLKALTGYIDWIDITLVANPQMMSLLFRLLANRHLQVDASACVVAVLSKQMDAFAKLALIQRFNPLAVVCGLNMKAASLEFSVAVAKVVNQLGLELSTIMQHVADSRAPEQKTAGFVYQALGNTLHVALTCLAHPTYLVSFEVIDFCKDYICCLQHGTYRWRQTQRSSMCLPGGEMAYAHPHDPEPPTQQELAACRRIFDVLTKRLRYPAWYNFARPDDREVAFDEYRKHLDSKLFGSLCRIAPRDVLTWLQPLVQLAGRSPNSPAPEVILFLFRQVTVHIHKWSEMYALNPDTQAMAMAIMQSELSHHPHPSVKMAFFEAMYRHDFVFYENPALLVPVLGAFLDTRGIRHPDRRVSDTAIKNLVRIVKEKKRGSLAVKMRPMLNKLAGGLQSLVQPVLGRVAVIGMDARPPLSYKGCVQVCEVLGKLVTSQVVGNPDTSSHMIASLLAWFQSLLTQGLSKHKQWLQTDPNTAGKRFSQVIEALKSFVREIQADASRVCEPLAQCFAVVMKVYSSMPHHEVVRKNAIAILHMLSVGLKDQVIQLLGNPVKLFIQHTSSPSQACELVELLNHLVTQFKGSVRSLLDEVIVAVLQTQLRAIASFQEAVGPRVTPDAAAAFEIAKARRQNNIKAFFDLLANIAGDPQLLPTLTSPRNNSFLRTLLGTIFSFCIDTSRVARKRAFSVLSKLIQSWALNNVLPGTVLHQLVTELVSKGLRVPLDKSFDLKDAESYEVTVAIVRGHLDLTQTMGSAYLNVLMTALIQQLGVPVQVAQHYVHQLKQFADQHRTEDAVQQFRMFMEERKAQQRRLTVGQ